MIGKNRLRSRVAEVDGCTLTLPNKSPPVLPEGEMKACYRKPMANVDVSKEASSQGLRQAGLLQGVRKTSSCRGVGS